MYLIINLYLVNYLKGGRGFMRLIEVQMRKVKGQEDCRQRRIPLILAKPIRLAVQENEHALAYWLAQA